MGEIADEIISEVVRVVVTKCKRAFAELDKR